MSHLASLTSASSSVEEENNTPLAFWSVMTYQCLKHCQIQGGEIHVNTEAGHKFHSLCCVFLPRDVSTTGVSLISFFEVVCQKAFQFSRDCVCFGACQNISVKQNVFSRSFQITEHPQNI